MTTTKSKKQINEDELGERMMRPRKYSYLTDNRFKKNLLKGELKFKDYKNFLENNKKFFRSQQRLRTEAYNLPTEKINKSALSSNGDKRLQTLHEISHIHMEQALEMCSNQN